jgi:hypothetical protein
MNHQPPLFTVDLALLVPSANTFYGQPNYSVQLTSCADKKHAARLPTIVGLFRPWAQITRMTMSNILYWLDQGLRESSKSLSTASGHFRPHLAIRGPENSRVGTVSVERQSGTRIARWRWRTRKQSCIMRFSTIPFSGRLFGT